MNDASLGFCMPKQKATCKKLIKTTINCLLDGMDWTQQKEKYQKQKHQLTKWLSKNEKTIINVSVQMMPYEASHATINLHKK